MRVLIFWSVVLFSSPAVAADGPWQIVNYSQDCATSVPVGRFQCFSNVLVNKADESDELYYCNATVLSTGTPSDPDIKARVTCRVVDLGLESVTHIEGPAHPAAPMPSQDPFPTYFWAIGHTIASLRFCYVPTWTCSKQPTFSEPVPTKPDDDDWNADYCWIQNGAPPKRPRRIFWDNGYAIRNEMNHADWGERDRWVSNIMPGTGGSVLLQFTTQGITMVDGCTGVILTLNGYNADQHVTTDPEQQKLWEKLAHDSLPTGMSKSDWLFVPDADCRSLELRISSTQGASWRHGPPFQVKEVGPSATCRMLNK